MQLLHRFKKCKSGNSSTICAMQLFLGTYLMITSTKWVVMSVHGSRGARTGSFPSMNNGEEWK